MVNTVFKGDLAEVSWGKETGLRLEGDDSADGWAVAAHATLPNTSVITYGSNAWFHNAVPDNVLVGCILRVAGGDVYSSDDYSATRRTYYITANDCSTNTINVQPAMATTGNAKASDIFTLDSIGCPTIDAASTDSSSQVKSDGFIGLLNTFGLPEPEIDVRKQHVIGMGRDVNVLTSGRETLAGGSMESNAHTLKWMKYALGGCVSKSDGELSSINSLSGATILTENPLNLKDSATDIWAVQAYGSTNKVNVTDLTTLGAAGLASLTGGADGQTILLGARTIATDTGNVMGVGSFATSHATVPTAGIIKTLGTDGKVLIGSFAAGISAVGVPAMGDVTQAGVINSADVVFGAPDLTGGVQATGTVTATGTLDAIVITEPGSGYTSYPTVTITVTSGAGSASFAASTSVLVDAPAHKTVADIDAGVQARVKLVDVPVQLLGSPTASIASGDVFVKVSATLGAKYSAGDYIQIYDKDTHSIPGADSTLPTVFKNEIRRIIGKNNANTELYIEEPWLLDHIAASCGIERMGYVHSTAGALTVKDGRRGTPMIGTGGALAHGVSHTLFGHTHVPTFMIEQSFRQTNATPGREQMLRLFNGCKVQSAKLAADSEGECKLTMEYEATRHYTDTVNKFVPHRMFENTANTFVNRLVSGVAVDGEKPYLFQDLSVEAFGTPVLRGTQFEFSLANNNSARWYVRGFEGQTLDGDQVQHGGTHQALDITEAMREYKFNFSAIVEDDRYWTEMRTRKHHTNSNDIVFRMNKTGSAATRQSTVITLEDYTIVKANHPMPDDKGPVTAEVECIVRHLKIEETNPYYTL